MQIRPTSNTVALTLLLFAQTSTFTTFAHQQSAFIRHCNFDSQPIFATFRRIRLFGILHCIVAGREPRKGGKKQGRKEGIEGRTKQQSPVATHCWRDLKKALGIKTDDLLLSVVSTLHCTALRILGTFLDCSTYWIYSTLAEFTLRSLYSLNLSTCRLLKSRLE